MKNRRFKIKAITIIIIIIALVLNITLKKCLLDKIAIILIIDSITFLTLTNLKLR